MTRFRHTRKRHAFAVCAASTAALASAASAATWNGAGGDDNWKTGANWVGGVAPVVNSSLVFDGNTRLTPNNDFAAGTSFGTITFQATAGPFVLSGNGLKFPGGITDNAISPIFFGLPIQLTSSANVAVAAGGTLTFGGTISQDASPHSLFKSGEGALTLTANNTYTGSTMVLGGTLMLDFSAANPASIVNPSSKLTLASSNFVIKGAAAGSAETLGGLSLTGGATVTATSNGAPLAVNLGALSRNSGAYVYLVLPVNGSISTSTANANFSGGQQSILGGFAMVGSGANLTWAISGSGPTAGAISGLSTYSPAFVAGADVDAPTGVITPSAMTINSLRIAGAAPSTINTSGNLTIATGGILYTSPNDCAVNNNSLSSGNGRDLFIVNASQNHTLSIGSRLTGPTGLGILGPDPTTATGNNNGTVILTNSANDYTGNTILYWGQLRLGVDNAIPSGTGKGFLTLDAGSNSSASSVLDLNGHNLTLNGMTGNIAQSRQIVQNSVPGSAVTLTLGWNSSDLSFGGLIRDQGGTIALVKVGTNSQFIGSASPNLYSGGTLITAGRLREGSTSGFGTGPVTVLSGGQAYLEAGGTETNDYFIAGIGPDEGPTIGSLGAIRLRAGNGTVLTGVITLNADARITARDGFGSSVAGHVTGPGGLELGGAVNVTSTIFFGSFGINDYAGNTTISLGKVVLGGNGQQIPNGPGKGNLIINGSTGADSELEIDGNVETINGLFSSGVLTTAKITSGGSHPEDTRLIIGDNNADSDYGGFLLVPVIKIGSGKLNLSGTANTITVTAGTVSVSGVAASVTLQGGGFALSASNRLSDTLPLTLMGGTFSSGGFSETVRALILSADSILDLGNGASILQFATSNTQAWTGNLTVNRWSGSLSGGGTDRIFIGTSASGLTPSQLNEINFTGFGPGAKILNTGEVVPASIPEPASLVLVALGAAGIVCRRRRAA